MTLLSKYLQRIGIAISVLFNVLISFIMGLSFTLSKDGKAFAKGEYK